MADETKQSTDDVLAQVLGDGQPPMTFDAPTDQPPDSIGDPDNLGFRSGDVLMPEGRGRAAGRPPKFMVEVTPGIILRAYAYMSHPARRQDPRPWGERLTEYLDEASYRDAELDQDRAPQAEDGMDERLYDFEQLHMATVQTRIEAVIREREKRLNAASALQAKRVLAERIRQLGKLPPDVKAILDEEAPR